MSQIYRKHRYTKRGNKIFINHRRVYHPQNMSGIYLLFFCDRVQQHSLKVQWKRTQDAKRIYDIRCKEEVVCNQAYHQEIARSGKSSKEAEKVKNTQ